MTDTFCCWLPQTDQSRPLFYHLCPFDVTLFPLGPVSCSEPHATIQVPSLRSLINIASGPEHHTQLLIDAMAIPILGSEELLTHRNSTIRRDALLGISNITAGTAEQVKEVTVQDNGNVMRRVLEILRRGDIGDEDAGDDSLEGQEEGGDWRVLREAAWVVSNATSV